MLVLFVLLGVGAWSAWNVYDDYGNALEQEYRLLEIGAFQRGVGISGELRNVNVLLGTVIRELMAHPDLSSPATSELLKSVLPLLPELHSLNITDATGHIVASNNDQLIGFDASGREYFKVFQKAPDFDGFHISLPFKTVTGITATTLSRVLRDSRGQFAGVIVATLESELFDAALKPSPIRDEDIQATLINLQGDILNSVPHSDNIGKNIRGGIAYTEHINSGQETTRHLNVTKLDRAKRLVVIHNLGSVPLAIIVFREYDAVMADWRKTVYFHAATFLLLAAVTLFLAKLAARRQQSLADAHRDLELQLAKISELQTRLQEQVIRDPLTGLYNRRYLDETLPRELSRAKREGYPLAMVMLDLDHFKQVNDTYGHAAGDEVLKALSSVLRQGARESDIICRYGGEEFLIALPRMSLEQAQQRVEAWRLEFSQTDIRHGDLSFSITLSAGIAGFPDHGADVDTLLSRADEALYRAKDEGRNRVACFRPS